MCDMLYGRPRGPLRSASEPRSSDFTKFTFWQPEPLRQLTYHKFLPCPCPSLLTAAYERCGKFGAFENTEYVDISRSSL